MADRKLERATPTQKSVAVDDASPMIKIYPNIGKQRLDPLTEEGASQENLDANRRQRKGQLSYAKGGKVIKSESY